MILPFPHQQPEEERNAEKRGQNPDGYDLRRANVSGEHIGKGDKGRPKQRRTGNQEAVFGAKGKTCDMRGNQSDKTDDSGKAYSPRRHKRSGQNPADTQTPHIDAQRRSGFFTGKQRMTVSVRTVPEARS